MLLLGSIFIGFIAGFIPAFFYSGNGYDVLSEINGYLSTFPFIPASRFDILANSLVNYGKYIAAAWFIAFLPISGKHLGKIPFCALFITFILLLKGFSSGFTTGALIFAKGLTGLYFSLCLTLPQNLVFIPALIFTASQSVKVSIEKAEAPAGPEYLLTLVISGAAALLVSLYEAYAAPLIINILL